MPSPRALLAQLTGPELAEWMAYARIDPLTQQQRADLRTGILAALIANIYRKKNQREFMPQDFMLYLDPAERRAAQRAALMQKIKTMFGHPGSRG